MANEIRLNVNFTDSSTSGKSALSAAFPKNIDKTGTKHIDEIYEVSSAGIQVDTANLTDPKHLIVEPRGPNSYVEYSHDNVNWGARAGKGSVLVGELAGPNVYLRASSTTEDVRVVVAEA